MKIQRLYIAHYKIFRNFSLDLTHNARAQHFIVLAGINGSGKTSVLQFIAHALDNTRAFDRGFVEIEYSENGSVKTRKIEDRTITSRRLSDPSQSKPSKVIYYEAGTRYQDTAAEIIVQFIDTLIYEKNKRSREAYAIVQDILTSIFADCELQVSFNMLDRERRVLFKNQFAENITLDMLSGGEQTLITHAFSLYLADIHDSIILIDEPERSLHPNWQNKIALIYQRFAEKNNNQIILATHSPHIVASARKEQIRVLLKEPDMIRAIQNFNGSYGWKIDKVLLEILGTKWLRTQEVEEKLTNLREQVFAGNYDTPECQELQHELEQTIGYDDIDLALIRLEIAKRRKEREARHKKRTEVVY
jgi:predicted ATP-binding protein involved in virulence